MLVLPHMNKEKTIIIEEQERTSWQNQEHAKPPDKSLKTIARGNINTHLRQPIKAELSHLLLAS